MPATRITLDSTFIDQVKHEIKPHWGELGWVTYKRTYARWLPEKNRTENWKIERKTGMKQSNG